MPPPDSTTKFTVKVDTSLCIGAASCISIAPKLFALDEDNVAYLIDPATGEQHASLTLNLSHDERELYQEAADNCPTQAITLAD